MRNSELVKQHYDMGQKHMSKGDFEEAWKNFDKAISFGGKNPILLDCKAAAMAKLPEWRQHAYQVTKDMISKYPKDFRGYYRQASVLNTLKLYDLALAAVRQAVALGPKQTENDRQFKAIQELRATITMKKTLADKQRAENDEAEAARQKEERKRAIKARRNFTHLLSRDILLTIVEQGMMIDPNFVFRMGSVCREWRSVVVWQPSLWGTLVLRRTKSEKMLKKVKLYMERSRERLMEVKIMDDLGFLNNEEVARMLRPCAPHIRRLTISTELEYVRLYGQVWRGLLHDINYLSLGHEASPPTLNVGNLVNSMLHRDASSLHHLELITGCYPQMVGYYPGEVPYEVGDPPSRFPPIWARSPNHLAQLRTLHLKSVTLPVIWNGEEELLRILPALESFELEDVTWVQQVRSAMTDAWLENRKEEIADKVETLLPHLRHYSVTNGNYHRTVFQYIHAPALERVDVSGRQFKSLSEWFAAPGLACALPNIQALDVSHCAFAEDDILKALAQLPSLRFLNVSFCPVTNVLLEKLERREASEGGPGLVPELTGLSIACNETITGSPLKRFVLSRVAKGTEQSEASRLSRSGQGSSGSDEASGSQTRAPVATKKRSMFAPTPRASSSASSQRVTEVAKPSSQPLNSSPSAQSIAPPPLSPLSSSRASLGPSISWLCLDNCRGLDPELIDYLRKHVRFVSNYYEVKRDVVRYKGKGKWAWDAAYDRGCGNGAGGCTLRRKPGTKDGWYVHHTCESVKVDEEAAWTQVGAEKQLLGSVPSLGEPVSP